MFDLDINISFAAYQRLTTNLILNMKAIKTTLLITLMMGTVALFGQTAEEGTSSEKKQWHPYAKSKWPAGKEDKSLDSGQFYQNSWFQDRRAKKWMLGLNIGATNFFGDADKIKFGWMIGPSLKYSISQTFGLRLQYNWGDLRGQRDYQAPTLFKDNFSFHSAYQDWSTQMVFTLGNISNLRPLRRTHLHFFLGLGQGSFKSLARFVDQRLYVGGDYYLTHNLGKGTANPNIGQSVTERYQGRHMIVPMGMGFSTMLNKNFDLGFETKYNYTRSDDIDVYNTAIWQNRWWDAYLSNSINITFKFGNKNAQHYDWLNAERSFTEVIEKIDCLTEDDDNDGVANCHDKQAETPDSCKVYGSGEWVDIDYDGVPDCQDMEPFSDRGASVDENGVMIDSDGDGVPDHKDACPEEAGITIDGCPLDCSTCGTPCEGQILPKVSFRTGSSKISSSDDAMMYLMADKLRNCPDKKISVVGYADNGVKSKANQRLSLSRANAVIDFLAEKYGISRDRFEAEAGTTDDNNKKTVEVQMK